ncbi:cytochrome P450 [Virgisporangium aurantiacum]|uniref:Cytochrome P450 n=1 Tax=Virgisporangium aurantiacum TaxID=175570 RepID=A0A8J3ZKG6_9ACTN|nr:cytochrome P450 [Virgisporangium aurantiacum]GIJ63143.1 cytochrome P450 [Virgisporangium aurantiacum]
MDGINLVDPDLYEHGDPHAVWRWLRVHDPVHWHPPTHLPGFWAVTTYDNVRAVYRDHARFSSAAGILLRPESHGRDPGGGRTLALTDPPRHGELRAVVDRWFATTSVRAMEPPMRSAAARIVRDAVERGSCDFVFDVAARLPLQVICTLMGVPDSDHEAMFAMTSRAFGAGRAEDRSTAHFEILQYFEALVADRTRRPGDDLVSALVTAMVGGRRLSLDEVLLNCDNLIVGGTENVRLAAAGGMLALMDHPAQWQLLRDEPGLVRGAVEEVLRWTSPATHIMRTATVPVMLDGRRIATGDRVTLWNPSANRDDAVFPGADRFDVRRSPNRHLSLGSGEHLCIGALLARVELRILFEVLAAHVARIEPDGRATRLRSVVVNGLERLPVRLTAA